jgi:outer membrane protein TolC
MNISTESMVIDINQAIAILHRNNMHMKSMKLDVQMSERNKNSAWYDLLPPLNIRTDSTFLDNPIYAPWDSSKTIEEPYGPDDHRFNFELSVQTGLDLNFAIGTELENNTLKYDAEVLSHETSVKGLEYNTKKIFYSLLNTTEQMAIMEEIAQIEKQKYDLLAEAHRNGLISDFNLLQGEVSYESQNITYRNLRTQYESLMLDLKSILGLKNEQNIKLKGTLNLIEYNLNPNDLIDNYLVKSLQIRSLSTNLKRLENQKRLTKQLAYTPKVSLGYTFTALTYNPWAKDYSPAEGDIWKVEEFGGIANGLLTIRISLSLDNFLPGSKVNVEIQDMEDRISQIQISMQQTLQQSGAEIFYLTSKLENSLVQFMDNKNYEALTGRVYEMAQNEFRNGNVELSVLLNAQNELLRARSGVLEEQTSYLLALLDLEYKLNTPIEKISDYQNTQKSHSHQFLPRTATISELPYFSANFTTVHPSSFSA